MYQTSHIYILDVPEIARAELDVFVVDFGNT
jgi:hypothetical protein